MRRSLLVAAGILGAAALAVAPAGAALAHNYPVASNPVEGSTITAQPDIVSLTTNDRLLDLGGSYLEVIGPDGLHYATACATISGDTVETTAVLGPPGEYTAEWQVVSIDGHPVSGEFAFDWAPADGVPLGDGATDPACAAEGAATDDAGGASAESGDAAGVGSALGDALWIGGGILLAAVAGLVVWLLLRRRPGPPAEEEGSVVE